MKLLAFVLREQQQKQWKINFILICFLDFQIHYFIFLKPKTTSKQKKENLKSILPTCSHDLWEFQSQVQENKKFKNNPFHDLIFIVVLVAREQEKWENNKKKELIKYTTLWNDNKRSCISRKKNKLNQRVMRLTSFFLPPNKLRDMQKVENKLTK